MNTSRHKQSWRPSHILAAHNYRLSLIAHRIAFEYRDDYNSFVRWHKEHPYGPVTEKDHKEYCDLVANLVCSYMLSCESRGVPFDRKYIDHLWDSVEEWRV